MDKSTATNTPGLFWTGFIGTLICWILFNTVPWMEIQNGFIIIPLFVIFVIVWIIGLFKALLVWGNRDPEMQAKVKTPLVISGVVLVILLAGAIIEWTGLYDRFLESTGWNLRGKFIF